MALNSDEHVPTQQSVKAYVDNSVSGLLKADGSVKFELLEYFDSIYDRDVEPEDPTPADTNLPSLNFVNPPTSLILVTGEAAARIGYEPGINVSWTQAADEYVTGYQISYTILGVDYLGQRVNGISNTEGFITGITAGDTVNVSVVAFNSRLIESVALTGSIVAVGEDIPSVPGSLTLASGESELLKRDDGTIVTTIEELLPFLEEKEHPALTMEPLL